MYKKTHNLKVKHGTYKKDGETKNNYKDVGIVMQNDDGSKVMLIDPTVNFAAFDRGVDTQGNQNTMVMLSMFEIKEKSDGGNNW